uniref:Uncharacterized protein n=1 Tax=Rhizophora mucronata TaxID=61149 RepID=A0A2P2JF51_RHIMU
MVLAISVAVHKASNILFDLLTSPLLVLPPNLLVLHT